MAQNSVLALAGGLAVLCARPAKIQHKAHAEFEENPLSNQRATQTPIGPGLKDFL